MRPSSFYTSPEWRKIVLKNTAKTPKAVCHETLTRVDGSPTKSICPECNEGLLMVRRITSSGKISIWDSCLLCGYPFKYIDIVEGCYDIEYKSAHELMQTIIEDQDVK